MLRVAMQDPAEIENLLGALAYERYLKEGE
jgi:hypothetical protein